MAENIEVNIVEETINVEVSGGSTWDSLTGKPAAVAQNSFIVSNSSPFAWIVKTLAQVKAILGLGSAAYVDTGTFAAAVHTHDDRYYTETEINNTYSDEVDFSLINNYRI
jgi:hypothetical protein